MIETEELFKDWLARNLRSRGLRNREVAEQIGVSRYAVVKWLSGASRPMPETCAKLATLFDTPREDVERMAGW